MLDPIEVEIMMMLAKLQERQEEQGRIIQLIGKTMQMIGEALTEIEEKLP